MKFNELPWDIIAAVLAGLGLLFSMSAILYIIEHPELLN